MNNFIRAFTCHTSSYKSKENRSSCVLANNPAILIPESKDYLQNIP
ncbi:hypothetical protein FDUTEX481_05697 [Tolypothrix sp. PCC 7601]|nr:hypothetical protein FDUTEX481_05697 [Tolypothrix sp. PCC 7601]